MDKTFFLPILISLLLTGGCNRIVQINFVLPASLIPYYEWLVDFPGWQKSPDKPSPTEIWTEYSDICPSRTTNGQSPSTSDNTPILTPYHLSEKQSSKNYQPPAANGPSPQKRRDDAIVDNPARQQAMMIDHIGSNGILLTQADHKKMNNNGEKNEKKGVCRNDTPDCGYTDRVLR